MCSGRRIARDCDSESKSTFGIDKSVVVEEPLQLGPTQSRTHAGYIGEAPTPTHDQYIVPQYQQRTEVVCEHLQKDRRPDVRTGEFLYGTP